MVAGVISEEAVCCCSVKPFPGAGYKGVGVGVGGVGGVGSVGVGVGLAAGGGDVAPPPWEGRAIATHKLRLVEFSAFVEHPRDADSVSATAPHSHSPRRHRLHPSLAPRSPGSAITGTTGSSLLVLSLPGLPRKQLPSYVRNPKRGNFIPWLHQYSRYLATLASPVTTD